MTINVPFDLETGELITYAPDGPGALRVRGKPVDAEYRRIEKPLFMVLRYHSFKSGSMPHFIFRDGRSRSYRMYLDEVQASIRGGNHIASVLEGYWNIVLRRFNNPSVRGIFFGVHFLGISHTHLKEEQ